jgi:hypothetical protein
MEITHWKKKLEKGLLKKEKDNLSRKSKLKLYCSEIRPLVVHGCETWVLKESII